MLSGPYCTQMLVDLGAEVIKVEPPQGDATRQWGPPFVGGQSAYFLSLNRNKKSIVLDLSKKGAAIEIALKLARSCDVLVENFRPGVMNKLGLGHNSVKKVNPRIIYCSISGYGQTGPLSHKPGYDIAAFAASGVMSITGEPGRQPVKVGVPVADIGAGMLASFAISSALYGMSSSAEKRGMYLDISMFDSMISWLTFQAGFYFATGENPLPLGSAHPLLVPYQAFKASDRHFILAVGNDQIWKRACEVVGLSDLANDKRFATVTARIANRNELISILEPIFEKNSSNHWLDAFDKAGVPSSPISTVGEALESPHARERKLVQTVPQRNAAPFRFVVSPIALDSGRKVRNRSLAPPVLGEHSVEVLRSLNFSKKAIDNLLQEKIVVGRSATKGSGRSTN